VDGPAARKPVAVVLSIYQSMRTGLPVKVSQVQPGRGDGGSSAPMNISITLNTGTKKTAEYAL
jgi:hypothetical protein